MNSNDNSSAQDDEQFDDCLSDEALDRNNASYTINPVSYSRQSGS